MAAHFGDHQLQVLVPQLLIGPGYVPEEVEDEPGDGLIITFR
jgi:hypothetical protein